VVGRGDGKRYKYLQSTTSCKLEVKTTTMASTYQAPLTLMPLQLPALYLYQDTIDMSRDIIFEM